MTLADDIRKDLEAGKVIDPLEAAYLRERKAAGELAYRAEAVFRSEYHNTSHIEGAREYFDANMEALTKWRKAVEEG